MSLLEISLWNFTRPVPARQRHEVPGVKTTLRGLNQFDLGGRKGQFSDGAPSSGQLFLTVLTNLEYADGCAALC